MNSRSLREISLVQKLSLNWGQGNVYRRAVFLGDVDNDEDNELVIGSLTGNLAIFKGCKRDPWRTCHNLGSVSCIVVGGKNALVVVSSEGQCSIFTDLDRTHDSAPSSAPTSAPASAPPSTPTSPVLAPSQSMVNAQLRNREPELSRLVRRAPSLEGIVIEGNTIVTSNNNVNNTNNNNNTAPPNPENIVRALSDVSVADSRAISPPLETDLQSGEPNTAQLPTQPEQVPSPNPPSSNNPPASTPPPIPHHPPEKSPISTPSSSPTLRAGSAFPHQQTERVTLNTQNTSAAKRGSGTTSAQSTPFHSPVSSPGASPPSTSPINAAVPPTAAATPVAHITNMAATTSSANTTPFASPRIARRSGIAASTGSMTPLNMSTAGITPEREDGSVKSTNKSPITTAEESKVLVPSFVQKIPSNISAAVITDVDEDGKKELLVGTYDQTLFLFSFSSDDAVGSYYDAEIPSRPASPVDSTEKKPEKLEKEKPEKADNKQEKRCLRLKKKWRLPGQVGSIHICGSLAVVGLCEGTYITLDVKTGSMEFNYNGNRPNSSVKGYKPIITNISGPLKACAKKGEVDCSEVASNRNLFAVATLDGTIQLAELKRPPYWELKVGTGQLCALRLMDMNGDGHDEIVACWWDGTTLIVDKDRNIVAFHFDDRVSAFVCGSYAVHKNQNIPCFVYVTLFGEITIFHNVRLESVAAQTLLDDESVSGGWDRRELPGLHHSILYGLNMGDASEYVALLREQLAKAESESQELLSRVQNKSV